MALSAPNHTQVPNEILDEWMQKLTGIEFKVIMKICRNTFGWHKDQDGISVTQLMKYTGGGRTQIIQAIKKLEIYDLITTIKTDRKTTIYKIKYNELVQKLNQSSSETEPDDVKTSSETEPTKESNININIASKENGVPAGAPTPKRKKLNSEQSIKLKELITLFAERYKYIYKGKSILLTGKEIGCIKTLASKQPIEEIKERIKYLEWKVERNPEYFSLTPSCLLNNYNKLTEARDRYDN